MAAQESHVVRVGSEHAGVGLGIARIPALNLVIKQLADGVFVGAPLGIGHALLPLLYGSLREFLT